MKKKLPQVNIEVKEGRPQDFGVEINGTLVYSARENNKRYPEVDDIVELYKKAQ